jgi:hypothetical protein
MRRTLGLVIALAGMAILSGCVRTTAVSLRTEGEGQEVDLVRHWHGLTIGPCGFATGAYANYSIRLDGPGPAYSVDQVSFLDEKGAIDP